MHIDGMPETVSVAEDDSGGLEQEGLHCDGHEECAEISTAPLDVITEDVCDLCAYFNISDIVRVKMIDELLMCKPCWNGYKEIQRD